MARIAGVLRIGRPPGGAKPKGIIVKANNASRYINAGVKKLSGRKRGSQSEGCWLAASSRQEQPLEVADGLHETARLYGAVTYFFQKRLVVNITSRRRRHLLCVWQNPV